MFGGARTRGSSPATKYPTPLSSQLSSRSALLCVCVCAYLLLLLNDAAGWRKCVCVCLDVHMDSTQGWKN